jgi:hypothetical protein
MKIRQRDAVVAEERGEGRRRMRGMGTFSANRKRG